MGLKSVEMQVAIPRSQDAGRMQDEMTRQGQQFQDTLTKQQLREDLLKRTQVNEYDRVEHKEDDDEESRNEQEQREREEKERKEQAIAHPYLGTRFDLSR